MAGRWIGLDLFHEDLGVSHADELFMMFKLHELPWDTVYSDRDEQTSKNLVKLWTNFVKFHNPTPHKEEFEGLSWQR